VTRPWLKIATPLFFVNQTIREAIRNYDYLGYELRTIHNYFDYNTRFGMVILLSITTHVIIIPVMH
jgi:hypothetical protein